MDETDEKGFMGGLIDISKGLSWKIYAIGAVTILLLLFIIYWMYFSGTSKKENNEVKRKKKSAECSTDDESEQIDKLINEIKEKQNEKADDNSDE